MTMRQQMQQIIRMFKEETGEREVNMHDVARFAVRLGMPLPIPADPLDLLAGKFSNAAREEVRYDQKTGRPYRANHAVPDTRLGRQLSYLWVDIDEAPRPRMWRSLVHRREQIVGDAVQLAFDADHWNSIHEDEQPIDLPLDFSLDVEWRKNGPEEQSA